MHELQRFVGEQFGIFFAIVFDTTKWNWDIVGVFVLAVTGVLIAIQSWATKNLAENETRPLVDVGILCDKYKKHRLQFTNIRDIPAYVWTKMQFRVNEECIKWDVEKRLNGELEWPPITGYGSLTNNLSGLSDFVAKYKGKKIAVHLVISLAPVFLKKRKHLFYEKNYEWDGAKEQWVGDWGVPDEPIVPTLKKS